MSESGGWSPQQAYPQGSYPQQDAAQQGYPHQGYGRPGAGQIPPTNAGWAAAALIFFWPLAFTAFTASGNVVRLWTMGDHGGAQAASDKAKRMGKIALFLVAALIALYIVIVIAVIATAAGSIDTIP